jgi:hypothetical protein
MLELDVKFRKRRFVAKDMEPYFPNKTNKQLRDKLNMVSYKQIREEYLAGLGIPTLSDANRLRARRTNRSQRVSHRRPRCLGNRGYLHALMRISTPRMLISNPEVPAGEIGSSGSNSIDNGWSERIKTAALKHRLPQKVISGTSSCNPGAARLFAPSTSRRNIRTYP